MPRIIKHDWKGEKLTLKSIYDMERPDMCYLTFATRVLRDGKPIEKALSDPVKKLRKGKPNWGDLKG